ncbi:MAG: response regulator [Lachnospiraceae bacterium]|nr:response regulator [Lachnospiraceae bacterium]
MAKVLVADDAMFLRGMVRRMLEAHGHTIIAEAANGKEAVDQFLLTKPDVVIMDITMPDMDGIEAMRYIRSLDPKAKIVVCTALVHQKMVETAIENNVDGFIVKPFDEDRLVSIIERVCG